MEAKAFHAYVGYCVARLVKEIRPGIAYGVRLQWHGLYLIACPSSSCNLDRLLALVRLSWTVFQTRRGSSHYPLWTRQLQCLRQRRRIHLGLLAFCSSSMSVRHAQPAYRRVVACQAWTVFLSWNVAHGLRGGRHRSRMFWVFRTRPPGGRWFHWSRSRCVRIGGRW